MCFENQLVTCASKILEGYQSPYTSTAVQQAVDQALSLLGVPIWMNLPWDHPMSILYGPVSNPWNLNCVSGGSSGGSAAAVASGLCH